MFEGRRRPRGAAQQDAEYAPQKRSRGQRPVDFYGSALRYLSTSAFVRPEVAMVVIPPHEYYAKDLMPAFVTPHNPSLALCTQWVHTAQFPDTSRVAERGGPRRRVQFTNAVWAPSGRKLLCSTSTGEFILYNGQSFGAEHRTTAHEDGKGCKALAWSSRSDVVLSGDDGGIAKLWGANLQLIAEFNCNQRALRAVEWAPSERRFATAGQDGSVRLWDTERVTASADAPEFESKLEGHGGDVTTVRWHPSKALLATGSQDKCCRLWDPRAGVDNQLAVLQGHTEPVTSIAWHPSGYEWQLLSAGRDGVARLWDARMLRQMAVFLGHTGDVNGVAWHPTTPSLFASVGADGLLAFWTTTEAQASSATSSSASPVEVRQWKAAVPSAHDQVRDRPNMIGGAAWSPLGHILATYSSEVNIWARNKPGAVEEIRFQNEDAAEYVVSSATGGTVDAGWA